MNDSQVKQQIQQMVSFIRQEAEEKAAEIGVKAEEDFNIRKLSTVEAAREKIRAEYERKTKLIQVNRKMYVLGAGRGLVGGGGGSDLLVRVLNGDGQVSCGCWWCSSSSVEGGVGGLWVCAALAPARAVREGLWSFLSPLLVVALFMDFVASLLLFVGSPSSFFFFRLLRFPTLTHRGVRWRTPVSPVGLAPLLSPRRGGVLCAIRVSLVVPIRQS